jgi:hypothetical protein
MGLEAGLDTFGKSRPSPEFSPQDVQPAGSRHTDYASNNQIHDDVNLTSRMFRIRIYVCSLCELVTTQMQFVLKYSAHNIEVAHVLKTAPLRVNIPIHISYATVQGTK